MNIKIKEKTVALIDALKADIQTYGMAMMEMSTKLSLKFSCTSF